MLLQLQVTGTRWQGETVWSSSQQRFQEHKALLLRRKKENQLLFQTWRYFETSALKAASGPFALLNLVLSHGLLFLP